MGRKSVWFSSREQEIPGKDLTFKPWGHSPARARKSAVLCEGVSFAAKRSNAKGRSRGLDAEPASRTARARERAHPRVACRGARIERAGRLRGVHARARPQR